MSDQHAETLKYEATEIERLEAELAAANAKIEAVRTIHASRDAGGGATCVWCDFDYPCSTIRALADPAPGESNASNS